ncbi:MAG: hypothetical protein ACRCST_11600 [Turicibacter sp.]
MRKLIILEGLESSGKTTYLDKLKEREPVVARSIFSGFLSGGSSLYKIRYKDDDLYESELRINAAYNSFYRVLYDSLHIDTLYIERGLAGIYFYENKTDVFLHAMREKMIWEFNSFVKLHNIGVECVFFNIKESHRNLDNAAYRDACYIIYRNFTSNIREKYYTEA